MPMLLDDLLATDLFHKRTTATFLVRGRPGHNDRPALPSGHPITWGAITDGTVLDHAPYPFPVFSR